jgi:hypothetical protein
MVELLSGFAIRLVEGCGSEIAFVRSELLTEHPLIHTLMLREKDVKIRV